MKYVVTLGVVGCAPQIPEGVSYGVDRDEMLVAAYERAYTLDTIPHADADAIRALMKLAEDEP